MQRLPTGCSSRAHLFFSAATSSCCDRKYSTSDLACARWYSIVTCLHCTDWKSQVWLVAAHVTALQLHDNVLHASILATLPEDRFEAKQGCIVQTATDVTAAQVWSCVRTVCHFESPPPLQLRPSSACQAQSGSTQGRASWQPHLDDWPWHGGFCHGDCVRHAMSIAQTAGQHVPGRRLQHSSTTRDDAHTHSSPEDQVQQHAQIYPNVLTRYTVVLARDSSNLQQAPVVTVLVMLSVVAWPFKLQAARPHRDSRTTAELASCWNVGSGCICFALAQVSGSAALAFLERLSEPKSRRRPRASEMQWTAIFEVFDIFNLRAGR